MVITISGKSGCGKSTLAKYIAKKLSFFCIDVDKIVHSLYEDKTMQKQLIALFGNAIILNGKIERKLVGKIVFADASKMQKLTDLTWKYVEKRIDKIITKNKNVVLDYHFISKTKYFAMSNFNIFVKPVDDEIRLDKIVERDGIAREYLLAREKNSLTFDESYFDIVLINDYSKSVFERCDEIVDTIKCKNDFTACK